MIELVLPWPPSVNNYKKIGGIVTTKTGKLYQKRVNTNETKMFYYQVWMKVKAEMGIEGSKYAQDSTISLGVTIDLHPPSDRRYDVDNRLKVLLDSLTRAKVWVDDSQVCRLFIQKMESVPGGEVKIVIYEVG